MHLTELIKIIETKAKAQSGANKEDNNAVEGYSDGSLRIRPQLLPSPYEKVSDCSICPDIQFNDLKEMKHHFKSEPHLLNLKKRLQEPFSKTGETPEKHQLDVVEPFPAANNILDDKIYFEEVQNSPCIRIKRVEGSQTQELFIYKAMVMSPREKDQAIPDPGKIASILALHASSNWCIFLVRSGRVSAGIFRNSDASLLASKNIKRYTVRRGQGGSQSSCDRGSGKRIKSAGSTIRRHNEQHLIEDVKHLLLEWRGLLDSCSLIFWTPNITARSCLFQKEASLLEQEDRLRTIPFTIHQPCLEELNRAYQQLFSCHLARPT